MPRILIVYGTTDGHTRKIAAALASTLRGASCSVDVMDARHVVAGLGTEGCDGVIVAASIHAGGYPRSVKRWVRSHVEALNARPGAFVSVCLRILEERPEARREVNAIMQQFLRRTGWFEAAGKTVAGALPYTRYGWLKKWIMKRIAAKTGGGTDTRRDYEYTDWDDLRAFARSFADRVTVSALVENLAAPVPPPLTSRRPGGQGIARA